MAKVLIIYASKYGQTEKIANYAGERLRQLGHTVQLWDILNSETFDFRVREYDGVLLGAGLYASRFPLKLLRVVREQRHDLSIKPTAFFSVCMGILEDSVQTQIDLREIALNFFAKADWRPTRWTIFAGAITYSKYNLLLKYFMRFLALHAGHETNFSQDYEFTDWKQVQLFVDEFSQSLSKSAEVRESFVRTDF